jgi:hypothetical protein
MSSLRVAQILGVCEFTTFEEIWGLGNASRAHGSNAWWI